MKANRKWFADFLAGDLGWQKKAACKDVKNPDMFFPDKSNLAEGNEAIMLCFQCPVRKECKKYKKETGTKFGIWAGEFSKRGE